MRKSIVSIVVMLALVASTIAMPAWATGMTSIATTKSDVNAEAVTISADDDNVDAVIDGCSFAVGSFVRASKGSNQDIAGEYHGYAYYIGSKSDTLMYLVTSDMVLVYINPSAAEEVGIDPTYESELKVLQQYLVALDTSVGGGNALIPDDAAWYFTTEDVNEFDGVLYQFNQDIDGSKCNCIIGADGSDVTDTSNPLYTQISFACFGALIPADDAVIAAAPSVGESFTAFIGDLDWSPLFVTLRTTLTAIVFIFILGLAAAYFCLHRTPKARNIFDTIFTIPMVLPPTVCGFLLLLALGSNTALGRWFNSIGFPLVFSWPATVIAAVVVAFPLMYRGALGAFDNLDPNMLDAARTLGWSESKIFFKIMLPLSWSSIAASTVLAFARALGEFGATLFLAGNYVGITRTIPIAIYYEWMNSNTDVAMFWTVVLIIFSFIVIMLINLWSQHTTRYRKGAVEE